MTEKSKPLFTETIHCTLQVHCNTCRNKNDGRVFRRNMRDSFGTPDNEIDFACPFGHPWGYRLPVNYGKVAKRVNAQQSIFKRPASKLIINGCSGCSRKKDRALREQQKQEIVVQNAK